MVIVTRFIPLLQLFIVSTILKYGIFYDFIDR